MIVANAVRKRSTHTVSRHAGPPSTAATVFATLASDLATASDLDQVFGKVLEFAVTGVHCDWATITLLPTGRWAAITVTSDPRLEERVARAGVVQPVCEAETSRSGGASVHVVELAVGRTTLGTIAYHAAPPNRLSAADTAGASLLATHAALAVMAVRTATELTEAIETQTVIAQAQGILMERLELDGGEAFALLRRCSQDSNLKLADIAQTVVTTRRLPQPD